MISQITNIEPRGSFQGSNGLMYKFQVTFADGMSGEANSKSQTPPYRIGEQANYEQTRVYQGNPCLKIGKPNQPGAAPAPQQYQAPQQYAPQPAPAPAYQPPPQTPPNPTQWRPNGQSVGMAIVQACEFLRSSGTGFDKHKAWQVASDILRLGHKLELGQLAPLANAQPPPPAQPAPPPPQSTKPRPGPEGQAFDYSNQPPTVTQADGDEIPF